MASITIIYADDYGNTNERTYKDVYNVNFSTSFPRNPMEATTEEIWKGIVIHHPCIEYEISCDLSFDYRDR